MTDEPFTTPESSSILDFARENGIYLTVAKIMGAALRRTRDGMLARRLGTRGLQIGKDPKLGGLAHIRVGENFSSGNALWLEAITTFAGQAYAPTIQIGAHCNLSDQVHIACTNRVTIGDGLLCGSRVVISDHSHGIYSGDGQSPPTQRPNQRRLSNDRTVTIGRNVWIGDGAAILGGAEIGDGAVIGANSVVAGPIPAGTMAAGSPARVIRRWDEAASAWVRVASE